jgi:hypothetical protein
VKRVKVTEHMLPAAARVLPTAGGSDMANKKAAAGGIEDLEELERRMLLQELQEIRLRSRKSMMEPITEEAELAFRYKVWNRNRNRRSPSGCGS